jgi:CelD/BcsL family acetyltransferase involved in cellulose biosynthesis
MSFFSSEAFLSVVAQVRHPQRRHSVEDVRVGDDTFRLLVIDDHHVVTRCPFLDYVEPCPRPARATERTIAYLPRAVHAVIPAAAWDETLPSRFQPSPFIDWRAFDTWEAFLAQVHERSPYPFKINQRKRRKVARELGDLRHRQDSYDEALLRQCMEWKSAQYRRTGLWDLFAEPRNRELFFELGRRGLLAIDTLWAERRLLAIHAGVMWEGRFYYWLTAHDPELSGYSPGTLLLEDLLEESYKQGSEFDFLLGNEPYKWLFATHARLVGPFGTARLPARLLQAVREGAMRRVRQQARLHATLRQVKRRFKNATVGR